jgi:hypothetical protein
MAKLIWSSPAEKTFRSGISKGVLYKSSGSGYDLAYPWNGLVGVEETPSGGEVTPYYYDGVRFHNDYATDEFSAKISAYTYPQAFESCLGEQKVGNWLMAQNQTRERFGLSYQVNVGDANDKEDYEIHLIYNASVSPISKSYATDTINKNLSTFSFQIETIPEIVSNQRPTAHFVVPSKLISPATLTQLTDGLYGTNSTNAQLPPADAIAGLSIMYP